MIYRLAQGIRIEEFIQTLRTCSNNMYLFYLFIKLNVCGDPGYMVSA